MARAHFTPALFDFLRDLAENNDRAWFTAHRERYRAEVQDPLLRFIADMARPLAAISPHFVADPRPSGGSMFRIFRDVRFARDKKPYKTHAAAQFRHRAGSDVHAPGFYLHLEPGSVFLGGGIWHPPADALAAIRRAILEAPKTWRAAVTDPELTRHHALGGDSLKRAPAGIDPAHPLIEDLRRKDFFCGSELDEKAACSAGFLDEVAERFRTASPLMRFLCDAVDVPF